MREIKKSESEQMNIRNLNFSFSIIITIETIFLIRAWIDLTAHSSNSNLILKIIFLSKTKSKRIYTDFNSIILISDANEYRVSHFLHLFFNELKIILGIMLQF